VYDLEELAAASGEEWVVLTGCRKGSVRRALANASNSADGERAARAALGHLTSLFGRDRVFVELTDHGHPGDDALNDRLAALAHEERLPTLATGGVHFATAAEAPLAEAVAAIRKVARPRMPVADAGGEVVGIVLLSDAFQAVSRRETLDLKALVHDVPVVSDQAEALDVLEILQKSEHHFALVYDEYGHFEGIITSGDVLAAITGAIAASDTDEPAMVEREDGSHLVAGWMPVDEFCDWLGLPHELAGEYDTVAGLILHQLGRIPELGASFTAEGYRFEVIDLDGRRIDKVLVARVAD